MYGDCLRFETHKVPTTVLTEVLPGQAAFTPAVLHLRLATAVTQLDIRFTRIDIVRELVAQLSDALEDFTLAGSVRPSVRSRLLTADSQT